MHGETVKLNRTALKLTTRVACLISEIIL